MWRLGSVVCTCQMCRVATQLWNIGREISAQTSLAYILNLSSKPSVFLHIFLACSALGCCRRSSPVLKMLILCLPSQIFVFAVRLCLKINFRTSPTNPANLRLQQPPFALLSASAAGRARVGELRKCFYCKKYLISLL